MDNKGMTDWADALRRQLENHEVAAPEGLWADIERQLGHGQQESVDGESSEQGSQPRRHLPLLKWGIAASLAALVAGGSYVFLRPASSSGVQTASSPGVQPAQETSGAMLASAIVKHAKDNVVSEKNNTGIVTDYGMKEDEPFLLAASPSPQEAETHIEADSHAAAETHVEASTPDVLPEKVQRTIESLTSSDGQECASAWTSDGVMLASGNVDALAVGKQGHPAGWSMRLYGENGLVRSGSEGGGQSTGMLVASAAPEADNEAAASPFSSAMLTAVQDAPVHTTHHMPVSVGMQVGIPLWRNLSLSTGLIYTQARSEFTYLRYGTESTTTQTLHYVGVPVGVDYKVWNSRWLRTYVSAGAEGAVCVSNHTMEEGRRVDDAPRDRMQWSVQMAAGIQFDILPQLGIYAEPGVRYYFDNGSVLENAFKNRKLNFNFQLGLRWNIK